MLGNEELAARINVMREEYVTKITNEAAGMKSLVQTAVLPAAFELQTKVSGAIIAAKSAGSTDTASQEKYVAVHGATVLCSKSLGRGITCATC